MREIAAGKMAKDEKTKFQGRRIVRGGEIAANRVHALLSKMFQLAADWKFRPGASNPCRATKRFSEHKIERYLSAEDFARLGSALNAAKSGQLVVDSDATASEKRKTRRSEKDRASFRNPCAQARLGMPEDVIGPALFFASDQSAFVTGQALNVRGGISFH